MNMVISFFQLSISLVSVAGRRAALLCCFLALGLPIFGLPTGISDAQAQGMQMPVAIMESGCHLFLFGDNGYI